MVSEAQKQALINLMTAKVSVVDVPKRTMAVLERENWYDMAENTITEAGIIASGVPTYQQAMVRIKRDLVYNCPILKKTLNFSANTVFMVTMGGRGVCDVIANLDGKAHAMRIYRPVGAEWFLQIMPDARKMQEMGLIDG